MRKVNVIGVQPSIFYTVLPLLLCGAVLFGTSTPAAAQNNKSVAIYSGSLRLEGGQQSSYFSYPSNERRRDAVIQLNGVVVGQEAVLLLDPRPSGIPSYDYEVEIFNQDFQPRNQDATFQIRCFLPGQSEGLRVRHQSGGRVILQEVLLLPEGTSRPARNPRRSYDTRSSVQADGAWGWPTEQRQQSAYPQPQYQQQGQAVQPQPVYPQGAQPQAVRPVPVDPYGRPPLDGSPWPGIEQPGINQPYRDPYYPNPEPVEVIPVPRRPIAAATEVVLYRGELKVRENEQSRQFLIPEQRRVKAIIVDWTDKDHKATGYLLVNGESRSRYRGLDVGSPSRDRWEISERIDSFRILARKDHVFLKSVSVVFDNFYDDRPSYPNRPDYPGNPNRPGQGGGHGGGHGGDDSNVVSVPGYFKIREGNYSQPIRLDSRRTVEKVVIYWNDDRENASGYLVLDNEPWNARRGAQVESPGSATFQFNKRANSLRIYARGDDIYVDSLKVYYAPIAYRQ